MNTYIRVKPDYECLHAGEIGELYAIDERRLYLRFGDNTCGYTPECLEVIDEKEKNQYEMKKAIKAEIDKHEIATYNIHSDPIDLGEVDEHGFRIYRPGPIIELNISLRRHIKS